MGSATVLATLNTQYTSLQLTSQTISGTFTGRTNKPDLRAVKGEALHLPLSQLTDVVCFQPPLLLKLINALVALHFIIGGILFFCFGQPLWGALCEVVALVVAFYFYYHHRRSWLHLRTTTATFSISYKPWEARDVDAFVEVLRTTKGALV